MPPTYEEALFDARTKTEAALEAITAAVQANDNLHEWDAPTAESDADELYRRMCNYLDATPDLDVFRLERQVRELKSAMQAT